MMQNSQANDPLNDENDNNQPSLSQASDIDKTKPLMRLFNPYMSENIAKQTKLNSLYEVLNVGGLGFSQDIIDKSNIANKKISLGKRYFQQTQGKTIPELNLENDGIFTTGEKQKSDIINLYRLERRLVRDVRQQFYSENGQLNLSKSFLDEKVSRLINISFQNNPSLQIYQKNAILSMRNNQSKSQPFEFEITLGKIIIINHKSKIKQQDKFQQLRPYLDWLQKYLEFPTLPHLRNVKQALEQKKNDLRDKGASSEFIYEVQQRLDNIKQEQQKEIGRVEHKMSQILRLWNQIKTIRRNTNMTVVPWKLQVRQYKFEGRDQYQIGLNSAQLTAESQVHNSEKQRRQNLKKQQYYIRVLMNGNQVTRSSKQNLQWPSFMVAFNQRLKINLYTKPSKAVFEIVQVGVIDKVIDIVNIKLPGQHANTLTSSERLLIWQNFASNGDQIRKKSNANPKEPSGYFSYRTQWKGTGSKMPPSRAVFADQGQQQTTGDEEENLKIQDPIDPRNISNKNKNYVKIEKDIAFQESKLPFGGIISTRQLLLKLRQKSQLSNVVIPLTQQGIRKRPDLLDLIKRQKQLAVLQQQDNKLQMFYNPVDGIFREQSEETKTRIKKVLRKIPMNRHSSSGFVNTSKYKLVDQIINQYTFDEMVSPIVVFFRDLFTQRRKLGPKKQVTANPRNNVIEFSLALQANSSWNVPMRDNSGNLILKYRQIRQQIMQQFLIQQVGIFSGGNFFQQQPNFASQAFQYYNNISGQLDIGVRGFGGQAALPNQGRNQFRSNINVNYSHAAESNAQDMLSNIERVMPYVQFKYGTVTKRTKQVEGTSPEWNEQLDIKFDCKKEKLNLQQIIYKTTKYAYVTLFDMIEQSQLTNAITQMKVKKTKYYLGHIEIPLSTIITMPKLSGFFRISRPIILLGYNTIPQTILGHSQGEVHYKSQNPLIPTHLSLNLTVTPIIDSSFAFANDRKFLIGYQKTQFLQLASDWLQQLNMKRYIRLWLNNADGQSVFISRFICEIDPPFEISNQYQTLIERTARFVSLIPHKSACKLLDNTEQFHFTLKQFLDVKMGDDHAFLLCSYFNTIDKKQSRQSQQQIESFVLVGKAFPEGKTTYVLRRNNLKFVQYQLWNPRTAQCYYLQQESSKHVCPLSEVGCIVSKDNVYVNIQSKSHPFEISFDISDEKCWKPFLNEQKRMQFFNGKVPSPYEKQRVTSAFYQQKPDKQKSKQIQLSVFNYVKQMIENERKKLLRPHLCKMNMDISFFIKDKLLKELQMLKLDYRLTGTSSPLYSSTKREKLPSIWQNIEDLKMSIKNRIDTDRRIFGFPIFLTFTTLEDIWTQIAQTQIHLNQRQDMEFVLAVQCFPYPNFLTSVCIFIGTLE